MKISMESFSGENHGDCNQIYECLDAAMLGHRFYDPVAKRFLTPDTYLMENVNRCVELMTSCNLYGYARNNPITFTDPTGQYENSEIVSQRTDDSGKSHIVFSHGNGQTDKISMTLNDGKVSGTTYNGKDVSMSPKEFLNKYSFMAYTNGQAQAYGKSGDVKTGLFADSSLKGIKQAEKLNDLGNLNDALAVGSLGFSKAISAITSMFSIASSDNAKDASVHLGSDALPGPIGTAVSVGYSQYQKSEDKVLRLLGPTSFNGR